MDNDHMRTGVLPLRNSLAGAAEMMASKVPEVTIYFWIIKVLCTTVGETAADFLDVNLGFGLTGTSIVMGGLLLVALFFQFTTKKYIPGVYWLTVVLISVFGTLITDILTDSMNVPLEASTIAFSLALGVTFGVWYAKERTLSIHSIFTRIRESFYWLAILFTFALGTAAGDLMAESLGLGYLVTGVIVCAAIAAVTVAWQCGLDAVLSFWIAYILTRPLGASLGDYLTQANGGLGLGATLTSAIFLLAIFVVVLFLTVTQRDLIGVPEKMGLPAGKRLTAVWQVVAVVAALVVASGAGYLWRSRQLRSQTQVNVSPEAPLGDLSVFRQITKDTLALVQAGKLSNARSRVGDLEYAWDEAEAHLRPINEEKWTVVDDSIDDALRNLRSLRQDPRACGESLALLLKILNELDKAKPMGAKHYRIEDAGDAGTTRTRTISSLQYCAKAGNV